MSLGITRLHSYSPNEPMRRNHIEGEFDNLIDLVNLRPAWPMTWSHYLGWGNFMTASSKFPQWSVPSDGIFTITTLLSYFHERQQPTSSSGGYEIGIYVNEVKVASVWLYNTLTANAGNETAIPPITLAGGDIVRLNVESVADATNKWKNVTLGLFVTSEWYMLTQTMPIARVQKPFGDVILGTPDWDNEIDNITTYYDDSAFSMTAGVFIEGLPTTASKRAMFIVPLGWLNVILVRATAVFHGGTKSDTLAIDILQNISTNLGTLSLGATDEKDTAKSLDLTVGLSAGDTLDFAISDDSGIQQDVTISYEIQFRVQPSYTPTIIGFGTGPYPSADFKTEIDAVYAVYNGTQGDVTFPAYWSDPTDNQEKNIAYICRQIQGASVTWMHGIFRGGAANGTTSITAKRNGVTVGNVKFEDAADPINTVKDVQILPAVDLHAGDYITFDMTNSAGDQQDITIWLEISSELQPGGE